MIGCDPADLAALHRQCFPVSRPWKTEEFSALLLAPEVFLVTCPDGFALGRILLDEVELLTLAVAPRIQRCGFGRSLLCDYEAKAQVLGAGCSFLEVAATNLPAIGLYAQAGYQEAGRRKGYYCLKDGARADALVLRKPLMGG